MNYAREQAHTRQICWKGGICNVSLPQWIWRLSYMLSISLHFLYQQMSKQTNKFYAPHYKTLIKFEPLIL